MELLVEKGVDVNATEGKHGNALQAASFWGNEAILELLLENGVEENPEESESGV